MSSFIITLYELKALPPEHARRILESLPAEERKALIEAEESALREKAWRQQREEFESKPPEEQLALIKAEEERRLREAALKKAKEKKVEEGLLGSDCPPLQARLFQALCDGAFPLKRFSYPPQPLAEHEVMEIVYGVSVVEKALDDKPSFTRLKNRLRALQKELQHRLLKRQSPFRIVRPEPGQLQIIGPTQKPKRAKKLSPAEAESLRERLKALLKKAGSVPISFISTVDDCMDFVREELQGKSWLPVKPLQKRCLELDCTTSTFRRALHRLPIDRKRVGFGKTGAWYIRLRARPHKSRINGKTPEK
jgi:hypothetical protein